MQERENVLKNLNVFISQARGQTHTLDSLLQKSFFRDLRQVKLPSNTKERLDYLTRERELLLEIISNLQNECKVIRYV